MECLKDHHFKGSLTLEIEDLNFNCHLSAQEKVALLARGLYFYAGKHGIERWFY